MTKAINLTISLLISFLVFNAPAQAQFNNAGQFNNPGQIVIPNTNFGAGSGWLNSSLGSGVPYVNSGIPYVGSGIPYVGSGIPYAGSGIPYVGSVGVPRFGIPGIPGIPYVGSLGSVGSVVSRIGGLGYGGYGYGGYGRYGGWGYGRNLYNGGIPSSGKLSNTTVIQTGPSPSSGSYYTQSSADPSASGGYYKSSSPSQDDNAFYRSRYYKPASINNDNKNYWGGSGTPFPKDLNSTPWNP